MRMFFWGTATRDKLTKQAINLFHQSHPDITITSQYTSSDVYYTKLDAQIAAGKAPDLIQMDMRSVSKYVREEAMFDLTQYIYNQNIDLSDFDPIMLAASKVNNTIYGIPLGSNYQCMYYDTTMITRAGIGPVPNNMTWATFAQYVTELSGAFGYATYGTSDSSGKYDPFEIWIRQQGKELYTKEGKLGFEQADVAEWFDYWNNLRKNKGCLPMDMQAKLDITGTSDASVLKGKAVFSHFFSNQLEAYQAVTPHPLGLLTFPKGNNPGLFLRVSLFLSISARTKYPDQAASFISFLITDPGAIRALGIERGMPGSVAGLTLLKPRLNPTQQTAVNFMATVADSGDTRVKEVLDPPGAAQVGILLQTIALEVGFGKMSVSDGAKEFYRGAQKVTAS